MKNSKEISQLLNINQKKIKPQDSLYKYTWDSMAMISLISLLEKKSKKKININKMRDLQTVVDLDKFISFYL